MLKNAAELSKRFGSTVFLLGAMLLMILAIRSYDPGDAKFHKQEVNEEINFEESNELDNRSLDSITKSHFEFVKRVAINDSVTYEVYVKEPLNDLKLDTEELNLRLLDIWREYYPHIEVRVMVLNYGNMEEADILTINGRTVFKK